MTKTLIAYFSQGGSTRKVAERIAGVLGNAKLQVDLRRMEDIKPEETAGYDVVGIGFPVYIYRMPFLVRDFLRKIPDLKGKQFFVFLLYGTKRGAAGSDARKILKRKGGLEAGYACFRGEDTFIDYLRRGVLFSPDHPNQNELERASSFAGELVKVLDGGEYLMPEYDRSSGMVYSMERLITAPLFVNWFYRFFYRVDKKKCRGCSTCVKNCPTDNIQLNDRGLPKFGGNCISCWYCEMNCPQEAISTPLDWPVMAPFMWYNVRKALADPSIDRVRVRFSRGNTERGAG